MPTFILQLFNLLHALILITLSILLLAAPYYTFMSFVPLPDFLTRATINDSCIATYYFFWTNLTYLPMFFFTLVVILFLQHLLNVPNYCYTWLAVPIFVLYLTELSDYLALNLVDLISLYNTTGVNTLLTNTLNRYHPCIFYLGSIGFILSSSYYIGFKAPSKQFSESAITDSYFFLNKITLKTGFVALWLGSWWAIQEGTWGGWWNWDASETFGLLVPLFLLPSFHTRFSLNKIQQLNFKKYLFLLSFLFSYFFIQLNFDLTSHNFGARFFFFFNNNLFFLEVVGLIAFMLPFHAIYLNYLVSLLKWRNLHYKVFSYKKYPTVRIYSTILLAFWVIISYQPLMNYFTWNFIEINLINVVPSLSGINFLLILVLLVWLVSPPLVFFLLISLLVTSSPIPLFSTLLASKKTTWVQLSHWILVGFTVLNWGIQHLLLTVTFAESDLSFITEASGIAFDSPNFFSLDSLNVDVSTHLTTSQQIIDSSWNFIGLSNSNVINSFTLPLNHFVLSNYYLLATSYQSLFLFIEIPLLPTINFLFWILLLIVSLSYRRSLVRITL